MIAPKDNINLDGLEECVIGTELQEDTLVYSMDKLIEKHMEMGMDEEEAVEFIFYNIVRLQDYGSFIIIYEEQPKTIQSNNPQ